MQLSAAKNESRAAPLQKAKIVAGPNAGRVNRTYCMLAIRRPRQLIIAIMLAASLLHTVGRPTQTWQQRCPVRDESANATHDNAANGTITRMPAIWHVHDSPGALVKAVAETVIATVDEAVDRRGSALLALPGGRTPQAIFSRLRKASLPWHLMTLVPTDERVVPTGSSSRNDTLLLSAFGDLGVTLLSLVEEAEARSSADLADARLRELTWMPDLVWLGVGEDGHTASLFKGPDLERALDPDTRRLAIAVRPDSLPVEAPFSRVSLTAAAVLQARALMVVIGGQSKRAVLENALVAGRESPLPIGRLLARAQAPIAIHWAP